MGSPPVPKEHFISFKFNVCQGLPFRKKDGRQKRKERKKKITKQAFKSRLFLKGKKERKKKDAWMPALVVPWGEIPPDPPF
jgi:hypothetical protein